MTVGGTSTLGGVGTIPGPVTITGGGTLAPGHSPGILTTGPLSLTAATSNASFVLAGKTPGTGYSQADVNGNVVLTNSNLAVAVAYSPSINDKFTIISEIGTGTLTGTFATANGSPIVNNKFTSSGDTFQILYNIGPDGTTSVPGDVTLVTTAVPEPASLALAGLGAAGLLARRRRTAR